MTQLLDLHSKRWRLIIAPPPKKILMAIAYLARTIPLIVLDCGRKFDSSIVARAARGRQEIIDNIRIQRAFTCYEAVKLLEQKQIEKTPVIILDFLSTFYDENVKISSRRYLLENSLRHFQKLGQYAGLAVCVYPPSPPTNSDSLFERLQSAAPNISDYAVSENKSSQLGLF